MKRLVHLAAVALLAVSAHAQAECKLGQIARLPVRMVDLRPLVTTTINGDNAVFLADSGAFYSQITPAKAAEFHLRLNPAPYGLKVSGIGGEEKIDLTRIPRFSIAGQTLGDKEFIVGGSEVGQDNVGLIGQNILGLADTEYDLANGFIKLIEPLGCRDREMAYWDNTLPYSTLELMASGLIFPRTKSVAYINGVKVRVLFDTGAWKSILTLAAAKRIGIDIKGPGVTPGGPSGGIGPSRIATWIAPVDSFKIGDEQILHTHLRVGDTSLDDVDMLLGADFFISHHIYVAKSQHKIYFTYNGGHVFDLSTTSYAHAAPAISEPPPETTAARSPSDAEGLARRGDAFASRADYTHAIADLTAATALAPDEPSYLFERAEAYLRTNQPLLAMADLNRGLKLDPVNVSALVNRARLDLSGENKTDALADLAAADRVAAKQADVRLTLAELYAGADVFPLALAQYDLWIDAHQVDSHRAPALNGRCRVRALMGENLDKALADCNASLSLEPKSAATHTSRALVRLRRGDLDKAIADFDAALVAEPKTPWALYGRGLAKLRKGLAGEGQADIAAATALRPGLPERAKKLGLTAS